MLDQVKKSMWRTKKDETGSSIVELAIVFPILLLLFVAVAEMGRLFYTYTTLAKATKTGARYLSISRDATSSDPLKVAAAKLKAQSLVACGYTSCTDANGDPRPTIVAGLNAASHVKVTLPVASDPIQYVKVEIQNYGFEPGVFDVSKAAGKDSSAFYFDLTPATEMRYMK